MRWEYVLAGLCAALLPIAAWAVPLEVYGDLPALSHVSISPDGRMLAYETSVGGERAVLVVSLDDHKVLAAVKATGEKIRGLAWADNDHLLTTVSTTRSAKGLIGPKTEWYLATSYRISTGQQVQLMGQPPVDTMNIVGSQLQPRTVDGHVLVYVEGLTFRLEHGAPALFAVDPDSGKVTMVETGSPHTLGWIVGADGAPVAKSSYDEQNQAWTLSLRQDGTWRDAFTVSASIDFPVLEGVTADGGSVRVAMPNGTDRKVRIADGTLSDTPDRAGSYEDAIEDPVTHRIVGSVWLDTAAHYHFFDPADQAAWNAIAGAYPGENVELASWSDDRKRIVIRIDGHRDGSDYELVDLGAHATSYIGPVYKGVGRFDVEDVRLISYPAADGLKIPAYLTLPSGKGEKNLPLIVLVHGGPASRDTPEFDWWSQALASRGYAVLQPEFRGSAGFGLHFQEAGFGQWGRKMQTDVSDGVRYLAKEGLIDPKRVCIVGASYGGYAALAGATLDRGVYRCAVAVAPVADPRAMLRSERNNEQRRSTAALRYWDRYMGIDGLEDSRLSEISPLEHAADADIPVLLIHGKDDTVVPISQSEDMADALKDARKTVSFVKLDGEDHWLSRPETRLKMLTETVNFLEANDPPN